MQDCSPGWVIGGYNRGDSTIPATLQSFFFMITGLNRLSNQARVQSGIYKLYSESNTCHSPWCFGLLMLFSISKLKVSNGDPILIRSVVAVSPQQGRSLVAISSWSKRSHVTDALHGCCNDPTPTLLKRGLNWSIIHCRGHQDVWSDQTVHLTSHSLALIQSSMSTSCGLVTVATHPKRIQ